MAREQGPMSGFRDLLADQMIPRQQALGTIQEVYENYGFVPLKTPALERYETLKGKYGEEGEKLMYRFEDNGGREVAMRYDQTVPLARVVAQYGDLPKPYKRYALGDVWRGESPQAGRYREFTQFDADTVGSSSYLADTEVIAMMSDAMSALDLSTLVRVNDRRLLDALAEACGLDDEAGFRKLIGTIDKVDKLGRAEVLSEVHEAFGADAAQTVESFLGVDGPADSMLGQVDDLLGSEKTKEGIDNLTNIMGALGLAGYSEAGIVFDPTIARGLDYYTSTVYETTLVDLPGIGSVCSGGRFDNLIEAMGGPSTPAVGTSIGVDRLLEGMRQLDKLKPAKTTTQVFVANMDESLQHDHFALTQQLRNNGIAAETFLDSTSRLPKQFKAIDRLGVRFVVISGLSEKAEGTVQIKDLSNGQQVTADRDSFVETVKNLMELSEG